MERAIQAAVVRADMALCAAWDWACAVCVAVITIAAVALIWHLRGRRYD